MIRRKKSKEKHVRPFRRTSSTTITTTTKTHPTGTIPTAGRTTSPWCTMKRGRASTRGQVRFCVDTTPPRRRDLRVSPRHTLETSCSESARPAHECEPNSCETLVFQSTLVYANVQTIALWPCEVPTSAFVCRLVYQARTDAPSASMVKDSAAAGTSSAAYVLRH